ncbi:MAG: alpha/beta hydrolase [Pseudomonadota bacterium]
MTTDKAELIRPIAHLHGERPTAPSWFQANIEAPCEEGSVDVQGARISYTAWGRRGQRGLLFIHGGRAHRNWWRPFAPFFQDHFRVAALDMSGMGDSDRRDKYTLDCVIDEVFAVIEAAGLADSSRPIIVGHSFGGWVTLASVEREGERLAGAVVIDSPITKSDPDEGYTISRGKADNSEPVRPNKVYETIEEPISRFRFLPNQSCDQDYLVDYIAREGLTEVDGGWAWKFDPAHGQNFHIHFERDLFLAARCPLAFIYGEKSEFSAGDGFDHLRRQSQGRAPLVLMPSVHHHLMMEEPIAFATTLRTLLQCWPIRAGL